MVVFETEDGMTLDTHSAKTLLIAARERLSAGSFQEAFEKYVEVVNSASDDCIRKEGCVGAAKASLDLKNYAKALEYCVQAPGGTNDITCLFLTGKALLGSKKYVEAAKKFQEAADITPGDHALAEPIIRGLFEAHSLVSASQSKLVTEYGFDPEELKDLPMSKFLKRTLQASWKGLMLKMFGVFFLLAAAQYFFANKYVMIGISLLAMQLLGGSSILGAIGSKVSTPENRDVEPNQETEESKLKKEH